MKKVFKYKSDLFKQEVTFTLNEELNKLKGKVWAPKKLEEANRVHTLMKLFILNYLVI
jgi:hypothetical protein